MTVEVPHYIPEFIWKFWLSNPGNHGQSRGPRVHIYDVNTSDLREKTSISETYRNLTRSILQDIDWASLPGSRTAFDKAEQAFMVMERQAEEALEKIICDIYPSTAGAPTPSPTSRVPVTKHDFSAMVKFFVFLRFRNGPHYRQFVQELVQPMDFTASQRELGAKGRIVLSVYNPLLRQVRLRTVLEVFCKFFETDIWDMKPLSSSVDYATEESLYVRTYPIRAPSSQTDVRRDSCLDALSRHCWQYCREAEVYLGVAAEEDREFILPECCFGVLDESFGGGIGVEKSPESESFNCFFPILPTVALYILRNEDDYGEHGLPTVPTFIEVGKELELDIHLRNAMVLSNVPLIRRSSQKFISYDQKTPTIELDQFNWTKATEGLPNLESLQMDMDALEVSNDTLGPKLFFSSLSSIARSISSYDEFRCRWQADTFIDYSRLKQRCRQKYGLETVKKMWTLKRDIVLSDLTDEVQVVGNDPVAFGAFSDVWMGKWYDAIERKHRVVAIKYLRQVMVQNVREKLLKRLQAELVTWHQLCHRNLATLYGIIHNSMTIGMVSSWCEGGDIGSYLKQHPQCNKLKLLIQVAAGVQYLHHFNPPVVHGDLKGGNILVDHHEQAIITDFGLSKVMENLSTSMAKEEGKIVSSFFAGSTRWMAPELILCLVEDDGRVPQVTTASDVYAFASVCLEIITGDLPYPHRKNDYAVTVDIMRGVKPSRGADLSPARLGLQNSGPQVEESLRNILETCWDTEPFMRPSMEEVLRSLIGLEEHSGTIP